MKGVAQKALQGASWLALFKLISQLFSWTVTILVARILSPDDYGLMAMATILAGYAEVFSQLGLGAAIIQRPGASLRQLSSVFWLTLVIGLFFGGLCFLLAYPTALLFHDDRIVPITQTVSLIFIINSLQIVPLNLMKRELNFKQVGLIEMVAIVVSCCSMLGIAHGGGGVWTLVWGRIILSFTKMVLVFIFQSWLPLWHWNWSEAAEYLGFGAIVALGGSFHYLFEKSDRFFAGRVWPPQVLGYYCFAMQLAQIPTQKIVTLINQVSYSAFARLQDDRAGFNALYLNISKTTASLVAPLFVGGFLVGEELVLLLLSDKWAPLVLIFRFLCLAQIITALNAVNNFVHTAQGRPLWRVYFYGSCAVIMAGSFFIAAPRGLHAMLVPWFSVYWGLCMVWMAVTLKKIGISVTEYLGCLFAPFAATSIMSAAVFLAGYLSGSLGVVRISMGMLIVKMTIGAIAYVASFLAIDAQFLRSAFLLLRHDEAAEHASSGIGEEARVLGASVQTASARTFMSKNDSGEGT